MSKNNIIIALVVLCLMGTIWGSVQNKKSQELEKQVAAMKVEDHNAAAQPLMGDTASAGADLDAARAEVESLKAQNQTLLEDAAGLKGTVASQQLELAGLKKELAESDNSQALELLQAQRDQRASKIAELEKVVAAAKAELDEKTSALAAAEEASATFEDMKSSLANSVDAYSAKNQELSAELEAAATLLSSLEKALEERTKLLVNKGEELSRTKLNMNVLLSTIAGQNNSLAILEETRVALEKELANKFLIVEELQYQLGAQGVVNAVIEEAAEPDTEAVQEEAAAEGESHGAAEEQAPAH